MKIQYILGIDMGVASIGWAVVSIQEKFIDSGVRVFPAGIDNINSAKEKHPNLDRRSARGMRRRIRRKAQRKATICKHLQELGWMPVDAEQLATWYHLDVYALRSRAISKKVSLLELGRILLHINQRRGFLSLRKSEEASTDADTRGMLGQISDLQNAIEASGYQTLGNYLYHLYQDKGITVRIRNRHTRRSMLHKEFCRIWDTQKEYHPELTDLLRYGLIGRLDKAVNAVEPIPRREGKTLLEQFGFENLTFFQRRVFWRSDSIGFCELEPEERRAPIADRRFQKFRMLQEINNLKVIDRSANEILTERGLTTQEREVLIAFLSGKKEATFIDIKKHLCNHRDLKRSMPESPEQLSFNLESGGRTKMSAAATDAILRSAKAYGKQWIDLDDQIKNQIIDALTLPAATDNDIRTALEQIPTLHAPPQLIDNLLKVTLPTGYAHLSIKALDNLLPHMRKGLIYMAENESNSALHAAGYQRRDEKLNQALDLLPSFRQILDPNSPYYNSHQVEINNPVVLRALTELRKVINSLIRKYGKPHHIHLEMARDLKMSPKKRSEYQANMRKFEKERDLARKDLESMNIIPNQDAIQLYRLWQEQGKICIYSGRPITVENLFSGDLDIDHIYPYSKSADNSQANKVLCFTDENRMKGNNTPYEWLATTDKERYEEILQRAKRLPYRKYLRFTTPNVPDGFVNRDLNDTAWMAQAARQYLARLFSQPHYVLGIKGRHTSTLRNQWQLHSLLRSDGVNLKNRDDYRQHALDAIVIALCDSRKIAEITKQLSYNLQIEDAKEDGRRVYHLKTKGDSLIAPWDTFRQDVIKSLNAIWVSHRPRRKVSGKLHKETYYGKDARGNLVVRKAVKDLSEKEVVGICDPTIRNIVKGFIDQNGGNISALKILTPESPLTMSSGIPIKKVRTAIRYEHITLRKGTKHEVYVQSESTHHLAVFRLDTGRCHFEVVNLLEACRRLRAKEPIVQKQLNDQPTATFLFHLCSGDSIVATIDGTERLFVFKTVSATSNQITFVSHLDATKNHKDPDFEEKLRHYRIKLQHFKDGEITERPTKPIESLSFFCNINTLEKNFPQIRKVTVLPTGEIRNAK